MQIDWPNFTPYSAMIGGVFIGLAAAILLLFHGKICGISGITGKLISGKKDYDWRIAFILGLIVGGFTIGYFYQPALNFRPSSNLYLTALAGILVGFGTQLGNGCTSGHGVCGISRFSIRSIIATMVFMAFGFITVYFLMHVGGAK